MSSPRAAVSPEVASASPELLLQMITEIQSKSEDLDMRLERERRETQNLRDACDAAQRQIMEHEAAITQLNHASEEGRAALHRARSCYKGVYKEYQAVRREFRSQELAFFDACRAELPPLSEVVQRNRSRPEGASLTVATAMQMVSAVLAKRDAAAGGKDEPQPPLHVSGDALPQTQDEENAECAAPLVAPSHRPSRADAAEPTTAAWSSTAAVGMKAEEGSDEDAAAEEKALFVLPANGRRESERKNTHKQKDRDRLVSFAPAAELEQVTPVSATNINRTADYCDPSADTSLLTPEHQPPPQQRRSLRPVFRIRTCHGDDAVQPSPLPTSTAAEKSGRFFWGGAEREPRVRPSTSVPCKAPRTVHPDLTEKEGRAGAAPAKGCITNAGQPPPEDGAAQGTPLYGTLFMKSALTLQHRDARCHARRKTWTLSDSTSPSGGPHS